jgi:hypothetical protein
MACIQFSTCRKQFQGYIYITFSHWVNIQSQYADGFNNSMINDKDGHMPWPLILFTCTASCRALLEWQKNKVVSPKGFKLKLTEDRPDRWN